MVLAPVDACRAFFACISASAILFAGCAWLRRDIEKDLRRPPLSSESATVARSYRVAFPDVVEVAVADAPGLEWRSPIGPDGRLPIAALGNPRVEGLTVSELTRRIADNLDLPPQRLRVRVVEYNSRVVYLFGRISGAQREVAYRGPEKVLDVLRRAGGIDAGAEPKQVYLIRSHLAADKRPEVIPIDLPAIVLEGDDKTNIRVQPFDQIHIGEKKRSKIERGVPPWLRPVIQTLWNTRPRETREAGPTAGRKSDS